MLNERINWCEWIWSKKYKNGFEKSAVGCMRGTYVGLLNFPSLINSHHQQQVFAALLRRTFFNDMGKFEKNEEIV